jgi:hypothetical protein
MKQQSAGRHAAALGNIILIPNQPAFALTLQCCALITEITNTNVIVFRLTRPTKYNFPYRLLPLEFETTISIHFVETTKIGVNE